jgi:hypothetical protein
MRNLKKLVALSQEATPQHRIPLYYSFDTNGVYTKPAPDRFYVTALINPNEEADIIEVIERWKRL